MIYFRSIGYLGRLGNQLFQFSSAVGISRKRGYKVSFPLENCSRFIPNGPIDPKTGQMMNVKCDLLDCFDLPSSYFRSINELIPSSVYSERDFKFNPEVLTLPPHTDLYGYFQDERYFKEDRDFLLSILKFKEEYESIAQEFIAGIDPGYQKVSLHIRRGDYTLYPNHHPVCSKDYYQSAMGKFSSEEIKFLVFSDDIEWCKEEFKGDQFIFVDSGSPYSDLRIMTLCDHHITANSSYSWWGAWLNTKTNKRVIAPSRWFGPAINKDASEIYCEGWEKI
jgi:hypothetical protein